MQQVLASASAATERPFRAPTSFKSMRVLYLFKTEIRWGGGCRGRSLSASPHLHENEGPDAFLVLFLPPTIRQIAA